MAENLEVDVLVVGGSQSGVTAAIQAARQGSRVALVSQGEWLGGSLTEAGIAAIDGNELLAFQTGLWGEFISRLAKKEENLLQYGWVSFFTFNPKLGNEVFVDWVGEEKNIIWLKNLKPTEVILDQLGKYPKFTGVKFSDSSSIKAKVTIDATEFGDLLELGKVPYRLGWEYAGEFKEPSAPLAKSSLMMRYPLQELTWAFFIKDYGKGNKAPKITTPVGYTLEKARKRFWCAFKDENIHKKASGRSSKNWRFEYKEAEKYQSFFTNETFLTYGQVGPDLFMMNWPKCGNDYSLGIERLFSKKPEDKQRFYKEARTYSLWFAKYIQDTLGERFGLADEVFTASEDNNQIPGFAYIPYNREVRRLEGLETLTENEILPKLKEGEKARYLPESIAIGNYANDHHYFEMAKPSSSKFFKLAPKSIKWGGRYTGTPFSIPYKVLLPVKVDGLIVAEKSWSVSHIANGSTRLQPVCMLVGQAAGSAASIAAKKNILPFNVSVKELQAVLLNDPVSPPTLIPLYDLKPDNPYRAAIQRLILSGVIDFPKDGNFHPKEVIQPKELDIWLLKAKLTKEDLGNIDFSSLQRDHAAFLIESKANTFSVLPINADNKQQLPDYKVQKYCAKLKKTGDGENFKAEWIKDQYGKSITRITPFASGPANTAGLVTLDPEVYKFFQEQLASEAQDFCFMGVYNPSGAWLLVTKIPF